MTAAILILLTALSLGVVVVRRRSFAVGIVTVQALLLAAVAMTVDHDPIGGGAFALRGAVLAVFFLFFIRRTREPRPVRAGMPPLARAGIAVALALLAIWLIPDYGLEVSAAQRAALTIIAFGLATAATHRATLFQVLGIILVENGLALAALALPGESSLVIEFGVTLDLLLIALIAGVFHERIFAQFGTGDSAPLRSLHD